MTNDPVLLRLRRANPVPDPGRVDRADLYAEITSLEPDRRLSRPPAHRRRVLVAAFSLVATALLASTAFAISDWLGGPVKPDVTQQEYRAAQQALTLPPGATWPALHIDANSVTGRGAGGGHAVLVAQNAWECYWVQAIRDRDVVAQHRARKALDALLADNILVAPVGAPEDWTPPVPPNHPYAIFAADGGLGWVRQTYAQAAAGHPQRLAQSCRANAPR